jgi:hypothetical protein
MLARECSALGEGLHDEDVEIELVIDASLEREVESLPLRAGGLSELDCVATAVLDWVGETFEFESVGTRYVLLGESENEMDVDTVYDTDGVPLLLLSVMEREWEDDDVMVIVSEAELTCCDSDLDGVDDALTLIETEDSRDCVNEGEPLDVPLGVTEWSSVDVKVVLGVVDVDSLLEVDATSESLADGLSLRDGLDVTLADKLNVDDVVSDPVTVMLLSSVTDGFVFVMLDDVLWVPSKE